MEPTEAREKNREETSADVFPFKRPPGRPTLSGKPVFVKTSMKECNNCHKEFRKGVMYERHEIKIHPENKKAFLCKFCTRNFFTEEELLQHITEHWTAGSVCPLSDECNCLLVFKRRAAVLSHLMHKHLNVQDKINEPFKFECKKSKKNKENPPTCEFCDKIFTKPCLLNRHIKIHTKEKPFECSMCGLKFSQKNSLILHNSIHLNSLPHKCPKCPAAFNQFINLKTHMNNLHPSIIPENTWNCPYCSCIFRQNWTLKMHIDKYHKNSEDQLINDTIIDVMNSLATLDDQGNSEIERIHSDLFSSENLDLLSTKNESSFIRKDLQHNTNILENNLISNVKKLHKCKMCDKVFKKNCDLTRHVSVHSNIKPFDCDVCGRKFRLNSQMTRHKKNMHKELQNGSVKEANVKNTINLSAPENCKNSVLESCINSLNLSPLEISNQISFESKEIFESVLNDDDIRFNPITIDSVNQNNFDADVSVLFNNSSLDNESMNVESNFIILDSNYENNIKDTDFDDNESEIAQELEVCKFLEDSSFLDVSQLSENICLEDNISINEVQDSLNDHMSFPNNDISCVVDDYNNDDLIPMKYDTSLENSLIENNLDVPTISIPNSDMCHIDLKLLPDKDSERSPTYINTEITDVDILNFVHMNNIKSPSKISKTKTKSKIANKTFKNDLAIIKEIVQKKPKYKDPPLPNRCEICPASFSKPCDLVRHRRVHSREKPFRCETCGASFAVKSTLLVHERKHISNENRVKYMCQVCGKAFTNSSALSIHKTIHLEMRSFVCPICSSTFRTSGHLDTHLIAHLKNNCSVLKKNKRKLPKFFN